MPDNYLPSTSFQQYIPASSMPGAPLVSASNSSWLDDNGGALSNGLDAVGQLGDIFGAQGQGAQNQQFQQGQLNNQANNSLVALYNAQQNAQNEAAKTDLERQAYATQNRATTAKQALLGSLLGGGYQPTSVNVPGIQTANISGGLRSALQSNPGALAAMQTLAQQASKAQHTPLSFTGGNLVAPPKLNPVPQLSTGAAGQTGGFLQDLFGIGKAVLPFLPLLF